MVLDTVSQRDDPMVAAQASRRKDSTENGLAWAIGQREGLNGNDTLGFVRSASAKHYFAAAPVNMVSSITTSVRA